MQRGTQHTEETKLKMRQNRIDNPEKEQLRKLKIKNSYTEERRKQHSEQMLEYWNKRKNNI